MRHCPDCERTLDESEFGKNAARDDGLTLYCRACNSRRSKAFRKKYGLTKPKGWKRKTADVNAYSRAWTKAHPGKRTKYKARWLKKHPERARAKEAVRYALKTGKLKREPCEVCGERAEAHHPDYSKPIDVVWLCTTHHREHHKKLRDSA